MQVCAAIPRPSAQQASRLPARLFEQPQARPPTHLSWPAGGAAPADCLRMVTSAIAKLAPTAGEMMWAVEALDHSGLAANTRDSGAIRA